jgi:hypothetical protein
MNDKEIMVRIRLGTLRYKLEGLGSIPDVVIGIFHWLNPSRRTMVEVSTQPLTGRSTIGICGG